MFCLSSISLLNEGNALTPMSRQSKQSQWSKIQNIHIVFNITLTFLISNKIIFLLNSFQQKQPHHPTIVPTIHMVTCVHCSLFIHHVCQVWPLLFHFFITCFLNFFVPVVCSWNFLKEFDFSPVKAQWIFLTHPQTIEY